MRDTTLHNNALIYAHYLKLEESMNAPKTNPNSYQLKSLDQTVFNRSIKSYVATSLLRMVAKRKFRGEQVSHHEFRDFAEKYINKKRTYAPGVAIQDDYIGEIQARRFVPEGCDPDALILYFHGGAFISRTLRAHSDFLSYLAIWTKTTVVMPFYRLAPEHPFPAAVEDCQKLYSDLIEGGQDGKKLAIGGDSAGGNLALVTLQQSLKAGLPMPSCGFFISPGTDFRGTESHVSNVPLDPMFNEQSLPHVITYYLQGDYRLTEDERVSPLKGDFAGLPPLYFNAGSTEIFRDCSIYAANKARAHGIDVVCNIWEDMPHCFPISLQHILPEAKQANQELSDFLISHLSSN